MDKVFFNCGSLDSIVSCGRLCWAATECDCEEPSIRFYDPEGFAVLQAGLLVRSHVHETASTEETMDPKSGAWYAEEADFGNGWYGRYQISQAPAYPEYEDGTVVGDLASLLNRAVAEGVLGAREREVFAHIKELRWDSADGVLDVASWKGDGCSFHVDGGELVCVG